MMAVKVLASHLQIAGRSLVTPFRVCLKWSSSCAQLTAVVSRELLVPA